MIDYQVYSKFHSASEAFQFSTIPKVAYDAWPSEIPSSAELSEVDTMLLPLGIHGFFMKEKKWGRAAAVR